MLHTKTKWGINNCVREIGTPPVILNYFHTNKDKLKWDSYYDFQASSIPPSIFLSDPLLRHLNDRFEIETAGILKIEPNRCYKWHIDSERGVGANMLLTAHTKSFVLFGKDVPNPSEYEIVKFEYQPNMLYWFNTQIMHTVINFEETRYMFTLEFVWQRDKLTFDVATHQ
jgi:hypothetical protein